MIDTDIVRIILTGYADIEAVIQAVNEGQIFFYLTKPWRNNELEAVIAKATEHIMVGTALNWIVTSTPVADRHQLLQKNCQFFYKMA